MKTRQSYEKTSNKGKYLIGILAIFIVLMFVFSILGSLDQSTAEDKTKYKNQEFIKTNQGWITYLNNQQYFFTHNPLELENITLPDNFNINKINSAQKIYLSLNPEEDIFNAVQTFNLLIKPFLTPKIVEACSLDIEKCAALPIKTCEDATLTTKVISIKEANMSKITYQYNCLTIQGDSENLIKSMNKILLNFLGL